MSLVENPSGFITWVTYIGAGLVIVALIYFLVMGLIANRKMRGKARKLKSPTKLDYKGLTSGKHHLVDFKESGIYFCVICQGLVNGLCQAQAKQCEICGMIVHKFCAYQKSNRIRCKFVVSE